MVSDKIYILTNLLISFSFLFPSTVYHGWMFKLCAILLLTYDWHISQFHTYSFIKKRAAINQTRNNKIICFLILFIISVIYFLNSPLLKEGKTEKYIYSFLKTNVLSTIQKFMNGGGKQISVNFVIITSVITHSLPHFVVYAESPFFPTWSDPEGKQQRKGRDTPPD